MKATYKPDGVKPTNNSILFNQGVFFIVAYAYSIALSIPM